MLLLYYKKNKLSIMLKAIGIYREGALAGKAEADKKILELTADYIRENGFEVSLMNPEEVTENDNAELFFSMARGSVNNILRGKDAIFFNNPNVIIKTLNRGEVYREMIERGANIPETKFMRRNELSFNERKYILKPGNRHEFWFIIESEEDFNNALNEYEKNGIEDVIMQEFVDGEHIKFYGIGDRVFFPSRVNDFPEGVLDDMKKQVEIARAITGLDVYGGDFIIGEKPYCVDINDWPSFGSVEGYTQEDLAPQIGEYIINEFNKNK